MNIGSIIRELRQKKKITQEELAEYLGVSTQAVSRWETSVTYPDIILLPLIANIFSVTTDYLLSSDQVTNDKIVAEVKKNYRIYLQKADNVGGYEYMTKMIEKYPTIEEIQLLYTDACYAVGNWNKQLTENGIKIAERLIKTTVNESIKDKAIDNLFHLYIKLDKIDDAKELYQKYLKNRIKEDYYTEYLLDGNELIDYYQTKVYNIIGDFWSIFIGINNERKYYNTKEQIILLEKFNSIVDIIYEKSDYHLETIWYLEVLNYRLASLYQCEGNKVKAIEYLNISSDYAIMYDTRVDNLVIKSLIFNHKEDKREDMTWSGSQKEYGNRCYEFTKILNYKEFDSIRNEKEFIEIIEKVSKYKKQFD